MAWCDARLPQLGCDGTKFFGVVQLQAGCPGRCRVWIDGVRVECALEPASRWGIVGTKVFVVCAVEERNVLGM